MMTRMILMMTVQTLQATVTAKDLTLQLCALTHTPMNNTTVFCDVYVLHLCGQVNTPTVSPRPLTQRRITYCSPLVCPSIRLSRADQ